MNGDFDPLDLVKHAEFAAESPAARFARRTKRQQALADEIRKLALYEARFVRAFHKWDNQRRRVASQEKRLDKEFGQ